MSCRKYGGKRTTGPYRRRMTPSELLLTQAAQQSWWAPSLGNAPPPIITAPTSSRLQLRSVGNFPTRTAVNLFGGPSTGGLGSGLGLGSGGLGAPKETTPPAAKYPDFDKLIKAFKTASKDLSDTDAKDILDPKIVALAPTTTMDAAKDHIVFFKGDLTDINSESLAPDFGGPLPINVPWPGRQYSSPLYYVDVMKLISSASPAGLLSQQYPNILAGDSCDQARSELSQLLQQPSPYWIKTAASSCEKKAGDNKFFVVESAEGKFWLSLWIGLWAKYLIFGPYRAALIATEKKLLVYHSENPVLGIDDNNVGVNGVGVLLMLLRTAINKRAFDNGATPQYIFTTYIKPILAELLKDNGKEVK